jgi:hypothetical protein
MNASQFTANWTRPKYAIWVLIALVGLYWVLNNWFLPDQVKKSGTTTFNQKAQGLSILKDFSEEFSPQRFSLQKSPILKIEDMSQFKTLLILEPRFPLSSRETTLVQEFVRKGGNLVLGIGFKSEFDTFTYFTQDMRLEVPRYSEDPNFKNGKSNIFSPNEDLFIFKQNEKYEFYSRFIFDDSQCTRFNPIHCYVRHFQVGSGTITLLAGLPIFSNALIARSENRKTLFRLFQIGSPVAVDEYHQFFSNYTFFDLLKELRFSIPIFGFLILTVLYFFFAHTKFHERRISNAKAIQNLSFHHLNERVMFANMDQKSRKMEAVELQALVLKRLLPTKTAAIDACLARLKTAHPEKISLELLTLHKQVLADKRGKPS